MSEESRTVRTQPSWGRRQWLKIVATVDDHPRATIALVVVVLGVAVFYATRLGGMSHFMESGARWRVDTFGGTHHVDRAVRTPDVLLSFREREFNRLDALAPTAVHFGGTVFREELRAMAAREGGFIRIAALDPRLAEENHPGHARFVALGQAFGLSPYELAARCWHSTAVLLRLAEELADRVEIRLISEPHEDAQAPYFCIGRSGHAYEAGDEGTRLDVIVPRPSEPTGSDSFTHPGMIIKNRPNNPDVLRHTREFESLWNAATQLDDELRIELLDHIDGQYTPRS